MWERRGDKVRYAWSPRVAVEEEFGTDVGAYAAPRGMPASRRWTLCLNDSVAERTLRVNPAWFESAQCGFEHVISAV